MQQEDVSMDCGLYVATFAEFLSDQLIIPPDTDGHLANYLRSRYIHLLLYNVKPHNPHCLTLSNLIVYLRIDVSDT
ncbi:hypothetical protein H5410_019273 [Solanum commersonii]|uniref:Ubiquitin-like protease family profile domain-containing protein n=1 Tax=Solanum commersonii TaxID=4109 RepID=A0A9J6A4H9_SOLCO|nr:hypothetical protein H5410_019273 [Solanum commersonii]